MELFQVADLFRADVHFPRHILERHPANLHHHHHMIENVVNFTDQLGLIAIFRRDNRLRALLADLFQDFIQPLFKQVAGIRSFCHNSVKKHVRLPVWQTGPTGVPE